MKTGVLLMAYGSPDSPDDVPAYLADIRGARPSTSQVAHLTERYARIGMPSPLKAITERQTSAVRRALSGDGTLVMYGMKHWRPSIADAVEAMNVAGVRTLIGLALAPHYSSISIGGYEDRILKARAQLGAGFDVHMIKHWYQEPGFISLVAANVRAQMEGFDQARVFFTAHSLPERIVAEGDPYRDQLLDSASLIARAADVGDWELAFQSASATGEPWLGPDILDALDRFAASGGRRAVVAPIGFVSDHLEILNDIDVEAAGRARSLGLLLRRVASPNDDPRLIEALASAVRNAGVDQ